MLVNSIPVVPHSWLAIEVTVSDNAMMLYLNGDLVDSITYEKDATPEMTFFGPFACTGMESLIFQVLNLLFYPFFFLKLKYCKIFILVSGLFSNIGMFSTAPPAGDLSTLSSTCNPGIFGDVVSWNNIITNTSMMPYLRESTCDGELMHNYVSAMCF